MTGIDRVGQEGGAGLTIGVLLVDDHTIVRIGFRMLLDATDGHRVRTFVGHRGFATRVAFSPDGRFAYVSCNAENKVAAVNLQTWKVDHLIEGGKDTDGLAWAAAFERSHPD